eukprot:TRINITY_DN1692_c0_g1_i1.p1 TRINITY_DN1692_c0_g1~~TRINITY_DN1692_c0_g1_i1.p1  ORF type:complete len:203 (-),score=34.49 TRINITY_DN1692_c0_g1_i1:77-646(-)
MAKKFDAYLKDIIKVEVLDNRTDIRHMLFEHKLCLIRQARDVLLLNHFFWNQTQDLFMIAGKSIESHPDVPDHTSGSVRAHVHLFGYTIEECDKTGKTLREKRYEDDQIPAAEKKKRTVGYRSITGEKSKVYTKISLYNQSNLSGIPERLAFYLAENQPLHLAHVRNWLRSLLDDPAKRKELDKLSFLH